MIDLAVGEDVAAEALGEAAIKYQELTCGLCESCRMHL